MNHIPIEKAREYAIDAFVECIYIKTMGNSVDWSEANLNPDPIDIYDLNKEQLFYQFWVEKKGVRIGKIKIAANKLLGSPIKLVGTASPEEFDQSLLMMKIQKIASADYPGYKITSQQIVAYDNPSIGLLVELSNIQKKDVKRIIVDPNFNDYLTLPLNNEQLNVSAVTGSYYDSIPKMQIKENVAIWEKEENRIQKNIVKINSLGIFEKTNVYNITRSSGSDSKNPKN